jgi:pectate lyase
MRLFFLTILTFLSVWLMAESPAAFPGAEGYGATSVGGRAGKVLFVTNLDDNGEGSFRWAIEKAYPRTIIFAVSGTIILKSELRIRNSYLTIAGQTAPGEGICLKNFPLIIDGAEHVIVRGIRVRPGIESGLIGSEIDGMQIRNSRHIIIDHCTVSWSVDEMLNTWHGSKDITIQWCIFAEALHKSIHEKGVHGYGGSLGGKRASYHHNLFAHCSARNPSVAGNNLEMTEMMDFRNNVVFNWGHRSCDGKPSTINVVNNYYKPGPATNSSVKKRVVKVETATQYGFTPRWYISGNAIEGYPEIEKDNILYGVEADKNVNKHDLLSDIPFETLPIPTESATDAFKSVLARVGTLKRDNWEKRLLKEVKTGNVKSGNGHINKVEDVGGWPALKSGKAPKDTDSDGMPDAWEKNYKLDPKNTADGNQLAKNEYTNLENYLNSLFDNSCKKQEDK